MDNTTIPSSENAESRESDTSTSEKKNHESENPDVIMQSPKPIECQDLKVGCDSPVNESATFATSVFGVDDILDLTVFVGNLNASVTCEMLNHFFLREGLQANDISRVGVIWKFLKNSEELGITFVELASNIAFEVALTLNGRELSGNDLVIVPALCTHRGLIHLFAPSYLKMNDSDIDQNLCLKNALDHDKKIINQYISSDIEDNFQINPIDFHSNDDNESKIIVEGKIECSKSTDSLNTALTDVCDLTDESNCARQNDKKVINIDIDDSSVEEVYIAHDIIVESQENVNDDSKKVKGEDQKLNTEPITIDVESTNILESNDSENSAADAISKKQEFTATIKNLPPDTKEEELVEFFSITPEDIQSVFFLRNARSRRSSERSARAIVCFTSEECLNKCLAQTKSLFHYRQIFVEKRPEVSKTNPGEKRQNSFQKSNHDKTIITPSKSKCEGGNIVSNANVKMEMDLFVKHVHKNVSDRHLIDFFASAGAVVKKVYRFPDMNKVRGMAFTTMANTESVLRGLAMNGKMINGVKIKVSIRNDRSNLMQPVKEDTVLMFSTFIACLPIKESADSLKSSLQKFFENLGCSIKFINVPSAINHSGNRGYAYVMFENEDSLLKCQKLHKSEVVLNNCKSLIDVSKQWPELRVVTPSPVRDKNREAPYSQADSALYGRQNKRRRKGTLSPLNTWDNKLRSNLKPTMSNHFSQNGSDYPSDQLGVMPDSNSIQSEYKKYLEYLDFSDYARKVYDNQAFTNYETRGSSQCKQDYNTQTITGQQTYPPLSTSSSVPSSHANMSESLSFVQKAQLENEMRDYSQYRARDYMDRMKYEDLEPPHLPASSYKWRESPEYVVGSHGGSTETEVATSSNVRLNNTSMYRRSDKQIYEHPSLYESRSQYFIDKEANSSYSGNLGSQVSGRSSWFGSSGSDFHPSGSKFDSFISSISSSALQSTSGLAPTSIQTARMPSDISSFSRFERRSFPYNASDSSSYTGPNEGMPTYPMSATATSSRPLNEITHYGHHVLSAEEKRKSSAYENSSSFVSKLAQSGILSNAGYDSYPGVGGYHAN